MNRVANAFVCGPAGAIRMRTKRVVGGSVMSHCRRVTGVDSSRDARVKEKYDGFEHDERFVRDAET